MRYKVDLTKYTAECDANYLHLLRLFPQMNDEEFLEIALGFCRVSITVTERMPYTTELEIRQSPNKKTFCGWMESILIRVRAYHDLKTAEVLEFGRARVPAPRNPYPNSQMHQRDEKIQWNLFLGEWLSHVAGWGYAANVPQFCDS